jgi:hypothetical protein
MELILIVGNYAKNWHLPQTRSQRLTVTIQYWQTYWPNILAVAP